jgi:hypothetical protein
VYEKQEVTPNGGATGFRWVEVGREDVYFETHIDMAALIQLGKKAARNKSNKAADGPLSVRVVSRSRAVSK